MLKVNGLKKYYESKVILSDISLDVNVGENVAIIGSSGCGKTTLLNCISGFTEYEQGSIYIDNFKCEQKFNSMVHTVLHYNSFSLLSELSIIRNIFYSFSYMNFLCNNVCEDDLLKIHELLKKFDLYKIHDYICNVLSSGEMHRTAILRSLASCTKLLILDEPFSFLDKVNIKNIIDIIKDGGMSTLLVSHDYGLLMSFVDRVYVLDNGFIVQTGSPKEIYDMPVSMHIAKITGFVNIISGFIVGIYNDHLIVNIGTNIHIDFCNTYINDSLLVGDLVDIVFRYENIIISENNINFINCQVSSFYHDGFSFVVKLLYNEFILYSRYFSTNMVLDVNTFYNFVINVNSVFKK